MRLKLHLIVLFAFISLAGCASNGFLMGKPSVTMFGVAYPSKAAGSPIDVYQSRVPTRPYKDIARIEVADTNDNWSMSQILIKAREIGADAVIVSGRSGSQSVGSAMYAASYGYGFVATAIKYQD